MTNTTTHTSPTCTYKGTGEHVCGKPSIAGRSYCEEHMWVVYQKGSARARRKKDERVAAAVWDLESEFNAAVEELVEEGYDFDQPIWEAEEA